MKDNRVEETEPWSDRDRRRFWIAVGATLILVPLGLWGLLALVFSRMTLGPGGVG
jgi:hypothetical protein